VKSLPTQDTRGASERAGAAPSRGLAEAQAIAVVTRMNFAASAPQTWGSLMFYEQIDRPPPLHLRLLLPLPIRSEGAKSVVGDVARCVYQGGHLLKRVTRIDPNSLYEFEVVEQDLAVGGGLRLLGGCYGLRELPGGRTEVAVRTSYHSPKQPRALWKPLEAAVCHLFHRHLLSAIRSKAESEASVIGHGSGSALPRQD